MDLLQYGSSDDEDVAAAAAAAAAAAVAPPPQKRIVLPTKNSASKPQLLKPAPTPSPLATVQLHQSHYQNHSNNNNHNNHNHNKLILTTNPKKTNLLLQPIQGPILTDADTTKTSLSKNGGEQSKNIQHNSAIDITTFDIQRNAFQRTGVALGPSDTMEMVVRRTKYGHTMKRFNKEKGEYEEMKVVGEDDQSGVEETQNWNTDPTTETNKKRQRTNKRKRTKEETILENKELYNDSDDEINYGIWGPPTKEMKEHENDQLTTLEKVGGVVESLPMAMQKEREYLAERDRRRGMELGTGKDGEIISRDNQNFDKMVERKMAHLLPPRIDGEEAKAIDPSTKLHLSPEEEYNYKNESWIIPPTELRNGVDPGDVDDHKCYVPKKCTGRFLGHNKGVHRIRLFPRTGHLLLSGGLDGKCKVWNVLTKKPCRTYIGHSAAVRDVQFNNDGSKFLSCSFDRFIRLWDTESGKVLGTYTNRRVPYVIKFYPPDDNTFVVGCSDNKIVAYDSTTGEITQEYNHHLAPVNTITFVEDHGMKMVTSSDDKKILVWEWDIGVPIKYISDPTMHSIPVVTMHPTGGFFAGQSLDNHIVVYQGKDRFALQRKKKFSGHLVSGYACDIAFSPDGQFICSGDGNGKLFFWEWKRTK